MLSPPATRTDSLSPHTADPESTQRVLYKSAWFLAPRPRLDRTECAPTTVARIGFVKRLVDLAEISRSVLSPPCQCMGPRTAEPESMQRVLSKSAWFRATQVRGRDIGCAQNEDLSVTLDLICLSLPRSSDPWRREVERGLPTKVAKKWADEGWRERKR